MYLREEDKNSSFFLYLNETNERKEQNRIKHLMDASGNMVEDEEKLVVIATSYFRHIFEPSNPDNIASALADVSTTITELINDDLTAPVTEWEVKFALFAMHPEKLQNQMG